MTKLLKRKSTENSRSGVRGKKPQPRSRTALLLIDVINHFEFPDGSQMLRSALPLSPKLAMLRKRAKDSGIPVIYVNDNFGQWHSDAAKLIH